MVTNMFCPNHRTAKQLRTLHACMQPAQHKRSCARLEPHHITSSLRS
jgi:hypothetical protein